MTEPVLLAKGETIVLNAPCAPLIIRVPFGALYKISSENNEWVMTALGQSFSSRTAQQIEGALVVAKDAEGNILIYQVLEDRGRKNFMTFTAAGGFKNHAAMTMNF